MTSLTVADCLRMASRLIHSETARLDVEVLLSHLLKKNRTFLFTWPDHRLTNAESAEFINLLERREQGEPVAHILGEREFWSLPLMVNSSTLIPRPDTEVLIETLLELGPSQDSLACLDLGTGTGAIALAIASERPSWNILGVDYSHDAVALAKRNAERLGFNQVSFLQSDWFSQVPSQLFDVIVSNPPYIDPEDPHLHQGDVRFEPRSALIANDRGMADIRHIISTSKHYLSDGGLLMLEHGYDQACPVRKYFSEAGFTQVESRQDYGGNDRVSFGRWFISSRN